MKAVTPQFLAEWAKKANTAVVIVRYCRRYWNGAAFVYERNGDGSLKWTQVPMSEYVDCGQIVWKLDTPQLNVFKASNVVLRLTNTSWKWWPSNTSGIFGPDAVATQGYIPALTLFQIQYGYVFADGTTELCNLITGVWVDDNYDTQNRYVEVTVSGNEYLLDSADAQQVSDSFGPEDLTPSSADGTTKDFTSTSTGIWNVPPNTGISVGSVYKVQGVDYTLSGLGSYQGVVKVSFLVAPVSGAMKISGQKWKTAQKIEDLIGLLCDQAGIGSTQRSIQPAIFPGGSSQRIIYDAQADWLNATLTDVDPYVRKDSIAIGDGLQNPGFESGDFTGWTAASSGPGGHSAQVLTAGGGIVPKTGIYYAGLAVNGSTETTPLSQAYVCLYAPGTGDVQVQNLTLQSGAPDWQDITFTVPGSYPSGTYKLKFLLLMADGTTATLISNRYVDAGSGGAKITFSCIFTSFLSFGISVGLFIDDVLAHGTTATGTWLSNPIDLGAAPTAWGAITLVATLNGGTVTVRTQTCTTSGGTYDSLAPLNGSGTPTSALKQFLKIQIDFTSNGSVTDGPIVSELIVPFISTTILLAMADFTRKTCLDAITRLAQLCDYEFGFDGSGNFFFRSKNVAATPVFAIDQNNAIQRLFNLKNGYADVINVGQVTYNEYYAEYNSDSLPEPAPKSSDAYLQRIQSEDDSDMLLAFDADIAVARAQLLHDNYYRAKRSWTTDSYILPFVDLSDVLAVTYVDDPKLLDDVAGDPLQQSGAAGPASTIVLDAVPAKTIGIIFKPDMHTCQLQHQEVLS